MYLQSISQQRHPVYRALSDEECIDVTVLSPTIRSTIWPDFDELWEAVSKVGVMPWIFVHTERVDVLCMASKSTVDTSTDCRKSVKNSR